MASRVNKSEVLSLLKIAFSMLFRVKCETAQSSLTWRSKQFKINPENYLNILFDPALVWFSYFKQQKVVSEKKINNDFCLQLI